MADAKLATQWHQTSLLAAILANAHRNPKDRPRPFDQNDFLPPQYKLPKYRPPIVPISVLKVFVEQ